MPIVIPHRRQISAARARHDLACARSPAQLLAGMPHDSHRYVMVPRLTGDAEDPAGKELASDLSVTGSELLLAFSVSFVSSFGSVFVSDVEEDLVAFVESLDGLSAFCSIPCFAFDTVSPPSSSG